MVPHTIGQKCWPVILILPLGSDLRHTRLLVGRREVQVGAAAASGSCRQRWAGQETGALYVDLATAW
jgi:hypothetical protein